MRHVQKCGIAAIVAVLAFFPVVVATQSSDQTPRTAWDDPDIGGVWDFRTITPLERPEKYGDREFLTAEEAAKLEQGAVDRDRSAYEAPARRAVAGENVGGYNWFWMDVGSSVVEGRRTSLIVDPKNGRKPPSVGNKTMNWGSFATERPNSIEELSLFDRCIGSAALPIYPTYYNNYLQVFQAPDHVALIVEMMGSTRIIPLEGDPRSGLRLGLGDSRGHWEGDTLVVETTNFDKDLQLIGASRDALRMVERFTRVSPGVMTYEFTIDDPTMWERPWTAIQTLRKSDSAIFEYACHEGNYSVPNMLGGARKADLAEQASR